MTSDPLKSVREAIETEKSTNKATVEQPLKLGRYRILNEVGRGATALVYRAYDPQLDRFLAIKVLRKQLAKDDDYREGFLREARLAAQLTHSNIVTIFDVGISDNKPYIAMELMDGATLESVLKKNSKLSLNTVLSITRQLASALAYAHGHGVVHRDIKPGNILILKDKKTAKLTDFGIAQIDENLAKTGRVSDKVLGTPEYMSPEQILGKSLDRRSDLYSTGVLMYKMLSGLPPFMADDLGDLFKRIIKSKQPDLLIDNADVKDDMNDLLRKLLQKRPEKRYQNAEQLLLEIRHISNKLAKPKNQRKAFFSSLTTRWTIAMASSVFVSMCIGLVVVYMMQFRALSVIAYDYGQTVGKMIAYQSSEAIVLEDTIGLSALVKESAKNEQLDSIYILSRTGKVLASNIDGQLGKQFVYPNSDEPVRQVDSTQIYKRELQNNKVLFDVRMPIQVAERVVGELVVSYSAETIYNASNTTLITMLLVMLVTLLVVSIATLVLAKQTSQDYKRVTLGLKKMSVGRVDSRILTDRNDEASSLFSAFNQLAAYLERLSDSKSGQEVGDTRQFNLVTTTSKDEKVNEYVDTIEIATEDKELS